MADYIYDEGGEAQGFRVGYFLYDMKGRPIGRVSSERVLTLGGDYVGELLKNMVVEKPVGVRRNIAPIEPPADVKPPQGSTRVPMYVGYPNVFSRLTQFGLTDGAIS